MRGKNGIIHAMNNRDKSALSLALAIVGGMAAGMRCDASEGVDNSSQTNTRPAAYTVKAYTEGSDPFDALLMLFRHRAGHDEGSAVKDVSPLLSGGTAWPDSRRRSRTCRRAIHCRLLSRLDLVPFAARSRHDIHCNVQQERKNP